MPMFNNEGLGVITEGCKTTHGGYVLPVSRPFKDYIGGVEPRSVIVQGDMVYCPKCKGNFPIDECDPTRTWNDKGMVFHGHRATCGAIIISDHPPQNPALAEALLNAAQVVEGKPRQTVDSEYNQHLVLEDQDGKPLDGIPYRIMDEHGAVIEGATNAQGKTDVIAGDEGEKMNLDLRGDKP
jgi:uncharacterized Zn-binding protein involved in type VI secretion